MLPTRFKVYLVDELLLFQYFLRDTKLDKLNYTIQLIIFNTDNKILRWQKCIDRSENYFELTSTNEHRNSLLYLHQHDAGL